MDWFTRLFIKEATHALNRHSGSGGGSSDGSDDGTQMYILVDENGTEYPAVLVDEETVFDADANDIRAGKIAATDDGVTVGTKEIPSYITTEGAQAIPAGNEIVIKLMNGKHRFTKLQAMVCAFNKSLEDSVAVEKVCINANVYNISSTEVLSTVTVDDETQSIKLGITNESDAPVVIRYITYKEEY